LSGLISISGAPLLPGLRLAPEDGGGQDVGWITSAARSPRLGKEIALGYVKRGFNSAGSRFQARSPEVSAGNTGVPVELVAVPFI
jgi:glycine cleavage system aminomethyltransferase T